MRTETWTDVTVAAPRGAAQARPAGADEGGGGSDGGSGHGGHAGGRAGAVSAHRDAHSRTCEHGTGHTQHEQGHTMGRMGRVCELWRRLRTSETAVKLTPIAP